MGFARSTRLIIYRFWPDPLDPLGPPFTDTLWKQVFSWVSIRFEHYMYFVVLWHIMSQDCLLKALEFSLMIGALNIKAHPINTPSLDSHGWWWSTSSQQFLACNFLIHWKGPGPIYTNLSEMKINGGLGYLFWEWIIRENSTVMGKSYFNWWGRGQSLEIVCPSTKLTCPLQQFYNKSANKVP